VVVDFDNSELLLRPGMTATLTIITAARDDVLKVTRRAMRFRPHDEPAPASRGNLRRLWVESEGGGAESLEVQAGLRDDEFVEVSGPGLEEGGSVIVGYRRDP